MIIRSVTSTLATFKAVVFREGMNMLIADTTPRSSDLQSRNALGKSSLVELIHFLLGGRLERDSLFKHPELAEHSFTIELELRGNVVSWRRSGERSEYELLTPPDSRWPVQPKRDGTRWTFRVGDIQRILGWALFGLEGSEGEPSFRSLFPYFARRQSDAGFLRATSTSEKQQTGDRQIGLSYLLGLDWHLARDWDNLRRREKSLKDLRAAARGAGNPLGRASEIQSRLVLATRRASSLQEQLRAFRVAPAYHDLEREADELTRRLRDLSDGNVADRQMLAYLIQSLDEAESDAPTSSVLETVYRQAGIELGDLVRQRFADVEAFHNAVIENRRLYLEQELLDVERRISTREQETRLTDERRSTVLAVLRSHGALESLERIQAEASRALAEVQVLEERLDLVQKIEGNVLELDADRNDLQRRQIRVMEDEREQWQQAVIEFQMVMESLTEHVGSLFLEDTRNGPEWRVVEQSARSQGVNSMLIFAFDMTLVALMSRRVGPQVLIHDSHLYDGVDVRQRASALTVGAERAASLGFQYIVTMNSDEIPPQFDPSPYRLEVSLTDADETGGLFGFRFGESV